ncbi:hypothetical protein SAMN05661091_4920 [Paenibacillus uliginis N3/975]|uniref:Uncharacterized protein n=1 Tax=Paenibacillus uliginis N3/975 TaxID=1313296 RepID=A0A1X7HQL6_9BACL|nr:hypothetical protein SAMN05661091_4920 [Paenibacillus uliginis N3/975]
MILCSALLTACGNNEQQPPVTQETPTQNSQSTETENSKKLKSQYPDNKYNIELDAIQEASTVRAQVNTEQGELFVVSKDKEEIGHIGVPSVFGAEGDLTFRGNYDVVYKHNGSEQVIKEFNDLIFVQKTDKPISLEKISFKEVDIFLLTPEYMASRGYNSFAFGINKGNGGAFPIAFKTGENEQETINYAVDHFPKNENEKLVVTTRNTEEENNEQGLKEITYTLDLSKKQFVVESE